MTAEGGRGMMGGVGATNPTWRPPPPAVPLKAFTVLPIMTLLLLLRRFPGPMGCCGGMLPDGALLLAVVVVVVVPVSSESLLLSLSSLSSLSDESSLLEELDGSGFLGVGVVLGP